MPQITWNNKVTGDTVTASDMNQIKSVVNSASPNAVDATNSIPFNNALSVLPQLDISGPVLITANTTGAEPGFGAIRRFKANGVPEDRPDFSAFKLLNGATLDDVWDNTNNAINIGTFVYDGTDYCLAINHPVAIDAPVANSAPVASSVAFTGTQTEGQTLTGTYTYTDADSDAQGASIKKWYRSDNNSGLNRATISGATNSTYVLQAADVGKFIQFAVTPKAATGTTTGTEVFSAYSGAIAAMSSWGAFDLDVLGNLTKTGTTYAPTTAAAVGASATHRVAQGAAGSYRFQRLNLNMQDVVLGFSTSSTLIAYTSMPCSVYVQGNAGTVTQQTGSGNVSGTLAVNEYIEFDVSTSGVITCYIRGASRNLIGTVGTMTGSDIFISIHGNLTPSNDTHLYNPEGINLV